MDFGHAAGPVKNDKVTCAGGGEAWNILISDSVMLSEEFGLMTRIFDSFRALPFTVPSTDIFQVVRSVSGDGTTAVVRIAAS